MGQALSGYHDLARVDVPMQFSENGVEPGLVSRQQPYNTCTKCLQVMLELEDLHIIASEGSPKNPAHSQAAWHTGKHTGGTASSDSNAASSWNRTSDCTHDTSDTKYMAGQLQDYALR